jgi:DnaK suppressor protein
MYNRIEGTEQLPEDEYLNSGEVLELYNRLIDQANELYQSTLRAMDELTENQSMDPDDLDIAVSESNRELSLRIANRERQMLNKIRTSLKRIKVGEYGTCISCGEEIGYRRLLFRPVATMCIDCKTEQEQIEEGQWQ